MEKPKLVTHRPRLPTLWVDTSIALNLAAGRDPRCTALKELVFKLVRRRKLLCPAADQHEEFDGRQLDPAAVQIFENLSVGIHLRHRYVILERLIALAMKAYVNDRFTIETTVDVYFHRDPVVELENMGNFFVSVSPLRHPEIRERREHAKRAGCTELEALRRALVSQRQTYKDRLAVELRQGFPLYITTTLCDFAKRTQEGVVSDWDVLAVLDPLKYLHMWEIVSGQPEGLPGLIQFFASDIFSILPTSRIRSQLWADLLTARDRPIRPSDAMDIDLLEVAIPICHYVVTDKDMENRIKRRRVDREWDTQVFSLSTIDDLLERLRQLNV